jgi:hypothetical protein
MVLLPHDDPAAKHSRLPGGDSSRQTACDLRYADTYGHAPLIAQTKPQVTCADCYTAIQQQQIDDEFGYDGGKDLPEGKLKERHKAAREAALEEGRLKGHDAAIAAGKQPSPDEVKAHRARAERVKKGQP